jgi:hypothetical protein
VIDRSLYIELSQAKCADFCGKVVNVHGLGKAGRVNGRCLVMLTG